MRLGNIKIDAKVEDLIGKTITKVEHFHDQILLYCKEGIYRFYHKQDCCEEVTIDDICGDINDLCGTVYAAEERQSRKNPEGVEKEYQGSFTWTFYHFVTNKGYVDIRWYGESNGYYSEEVDLVYYPNPEYLGKGFWVNGRYEPLNDVPVLCHISIPFVIPTPKFYSICRFHEAEWYYQKFVDTESGILKMIWKQIPDDWNLYKWRQIENDEK